jgi:hypothetical protein
MKAWVFVAAMFAASAAAATAQTVKPVYPDFNASVHAGYVRGQQQAAMRQAAEQQARDMADQDQIRSLASALASAAPEDRQQYINQIAAIDPSVAVQYQQMYDQQAAAQDKPAITVFKCTAADGSVIYSTTAHVGCVVISQGGQ